MKRVMIHIKQWLRQRMETPEKARTTLSNIAVCGGLVGFILTLIGVLVAHL